MGKRLLLLIASIYNSLGEAAFWNGKPEIDWESIGVVKHSISRSLSNHAHGGTATSVVEGSEYSETISFDSGYGKLAITVTMGGTDITSTAVSGNTITIAEVTGAIVITVTEQQIFNVSLVNSDGNLELTPLTVVSGQTYNGALSLKSSAPVGTSLPSSVSYVMGESSGTASVGSNGQFTIANVSADITITAASVQMFVDGKYIKEPSGSNPPTVASDANWCYTKLIAVNAGDVLLVDAGTVDYYSKCLVVSYDDTAVEIDVTTGYKGYLTTNQRWRPYTVPSGATFVRLCFYKPNIAKVSCYNGTQGTPLYRGVESYGFDGFLINKSIKYPNNTPTDDNNSVLTGYLELPSGCAQIEVKIGYSDNSYRSYCYDSSKAIVGSQLNATDDPHTYNVPSGAAFIRCSLKRVSLHELYVYDVSNNVYLWRGMNDPVAVNDPDYVAPS